MSKKSKFRYACNYNGWDVSEQGELTEDQVEKLEEGLPSITHTLHDEDGYNDNGLEGSEKEGEVRHFIDSIVGEVEYDIDEDFHSS